MILPIKHKVNWESIRQKKQTQINKDNIRKNINRVDHDYNSEDKVVLNNQTVYKCENPYKGKFVITRWFTNGAVNLQYGPTISRYNIRDTKPYTSDTNVENISSKNV